MHFSSACDEARGVVCMKIWAPVFLEVHERRESPHKRSKKKLSINFFEREGVVCFEKER